MLGSELGVSIGIGVGLGVAYMAASYVSNRRALRSTRHTMVIIVAAMMLRMFVALILLVGIAMLLPVAPTALVGSFFVVFAVGLGAEVWTLHRKGPVRQDSGHPS